MHIGMTRLPSFGVVIISPATT